jgi:hypothetical protein
MIFKRYLIFGGGDVYARGGFKDLIGNVDTLKEVNQLLREIEKDNELDTLFNNNDRIEWCHVVDVNTGEIVPEITLSTYGQTHDQSAYDPTSGLGQSYSCAFQDGILHRTHWSKKNQD